jgi:hypothetical protein
LPDYADYIVFADESGDHGLVSIDPQFPVFALVLCVIAKADYASTVVPAFQAFKFDVWGHDAVVLHEHDIRKSKGAFTLLLTDPALRARFYDRLNTLMADAPIRVFASIIDKNALKAKYATPWNPYEIALLFCMERLRDHLMRQGQKGRLVHVLFESRGHREDRELEIEFRRVCANRSNWGYRQADFRQIAFEPVFVSKSANSTGLQLADLVARPIALNFLKPGQANRAYEIISGKLGQVKGFP